MHGSTSLDPERETWRGIDWDLRQDGVSIAPWRRCRLTEGLIQEVEF